MCPCFYPSVSVLARVRSGQNDRAPLAGGSLHPFRAAVCTAGHIGSRDKNAECIGVKILDPADKDGAAHVRHALIAKDDFHLMQRQHSRSLGRRARRQEMAAIMAQQGLQFEPGLHSGIHW